MAKTKYPEIEDIRKDIDSLKENTVELSKHIKKDGVVKTEELKEIASQRVESLKGTSQEQIDMAVEQVKQKPLQSVAIAAVAGLLAGVLLGRR